MLQIFIKDGKSFEKGFIVLSKIRFSAEYDKFGIRKLEGVAKKFIKLSLI